MEIRFERRKLKLLVTRISGQYYVLNAENNQWSKFTLKGSFKIKYKSIYDSVLTCINAIQTRIDEEKLSPFDKAFIVFDVEGGMVNGVVGVDYK